MNGPERITSHEVKVGSSEAAEKQAEKLRKLEASAEKSGEHNGEKLVADARKETEGIFAKEGGSEHRSGGEPTASPAVIRKITKREKQRVYKQTLTRVQSEMSPPARTFSRVIHSPIVEKTSDTIGNTVARPNALLVGGFTAFIAISIMYVVGRTYGYQLSGFEMIGAYIIGWVVGLLVDYFRVMATGKPSS
ncbi:MAG: hypothetical protein WAT17_01410 [Candidatus Saccharimonadales bacterium]|jgi:hypothetical protein